MMNTLSFLLANQGNDDDGSWIIVFVVFWVVIIMGNSGRRY
jgi:hypothetical protein